MSGTVDELSTRNDQIKQKPRSLRLKHVFKNVSKLEEDGKYFSDTVDHFGIPWYMGIKHNKDRLGIFLYCAWPDNKKEWSIDTEFECVVFRADGSSTCRTGFYCFTTAIGNGWSAIMNWETMEKECLVKDELEVQIRVKIIRMTGIEVYLRRFDDEECSDVALVVDERKFYVSKLYLASQSSYFKSMFLGKFDESRKEEIDLTGIDEYSLQKYLEMLYGEDSLDDETVGGILQLADMYDTKTLIGKCEEYLLEVSTKTLKEKLEMSVKYNLDELKRKCMSEIKTIDDVRSVIPKRIYDMDHTILADLLQKTLDFK